MRGACSRPSTVPPGRFAAGQTGQQVNAYERTASLVYRELGGGLRMWVWVLGAMIVALFVGFAWVTK